jgi:starvation-inducible DNA-binding protein
MCHVIAQSGHHGGHSISRGNRFDSIKGNHATLMIPLDKRTKRNALVNQRLAEVVDLQMQVKQASWNVKRTQSTSLHELFEEIAREVACFMDMVAERIVQLGGMAKGTVRTAAVHSRLEEYPPVAGNRNHAEAVTRALSNFGRQAREAVQEALALGDTDTADLFTEISRGIDKWLRIVQAHANTSRYERRKHEFPSADAHGHDTTNIVPVKPLKTNAASCFQFLTKFRQRNQSLRKVIICQSSIDSTLHTAHP